METVETCNELDSRHISD